MNTKSFFLTVALLSVTAHTGKCQPAITTPPQSQTNIAGTTATFTVEATGTAPLFYQWRFYSDLADQTNSTLVLTNVQSVNAGPYTVIVTNVDGATNAVATLTVWVPPKIISVNPGSQSVSLGANITFIGSANGVPPPAYQWRLNQNDPPRP